MDKIEKYWREHAEFNEREEFLAKECGNLYHEFCTGDDGRCFCLKCGKDGNA